LIIIDAFQSNRLIWITLVLLHYLFQVHFYKLVKAYQREVSSYVGFFCNNFLRCAFR
jgi:hypothetical protein